MQRVVGMILILVASGGIGVAKGMDIQKYLKELEQLKQIFWMLRREIQYTKTPFPEAFANIGRRAGEPFGEWLILLSKKLEERAGMTFFQLWTDSIDSCLKKTKLKQDDKELLNEMGMQMGYLDEKMQLGTIDFYLEQLDFVIRKTRAEAATKKRLYNCLGVMGGIFLVIILL